jgi:hypothetical protein
LLILSEQAHKHLKLRKTANENRPVFPSKQQSRHHEVGGAGQAPNRQEVARKSALESYDKLQTSPVQGGWSILDRSKKHLRGPESEAQQPQAASGAHSLESCDVFCRLSLFKLPRPSRP